MGARRRAQPESTSLVMKGSAVRIRASASSVSDPYVRAQNLGSRPKQAGPPLRLRVLGSEPSSSAALALVVAAPAQASHGADFGIQDDAWLDLRAGPLSQRLRTLDPLGAGSSGSPFAGTRSPRSAGRPADPVRRHWGPSDDVLEGLHDDGISTLVTLYGSPRWANGGRTPRRLPATGFGDFAVRGLPAFPLVRPWTAWTEPKSRTFSIPVSPARYVQPVLTPAYASLHAASAAEPRRRRRHLAEGTPSGMSPLAFMQGMKAAHARLDAYAQNPYPVGRGETPVPRDLLDVRRLPVGAPPDEIAPTSRATSAQAALADEFGYQTNPPDRLLGVSCAAGARTSARPTLRVWQQSGVPC